MHGSSGALTPRAAPRRMAAAIASAVACTVACAVAALVMLPLAAGAQAITVADGSAGPRVGALQVGVQAGAHLDVRIADRAEAHGTVSAAPSLQPPVTRRRGVPQMIIGGAALVGGAIVGDDVGTLIMLGGLGYGLYGLYLYLQ